MAMIAVHFVVGDGYPILRKIYFCFALFVCLFSLWMLIHP